MSAMQKIICQIVEAHKLAESFCNPAAQPEFYLKVEVPGYLPLVIEHLVAPDHGRQVVSIAHYGEQNGDAMRDPEMVFDFETGEPLYFRNDYVGIEQYVYETPARERYRPHLRRDLRQFADTWARNLQAQGFTDQKEGANSHLRRATGAM